LLSTRQGLARLIRLLQAQLRRLYVGGNAVFGDDYYLKYLEVGYNPYFNIGTIDYNSNVVLQPPSWEKDSDRLVINGHPVVPRNFNTSTNKFDPVHVQIGSFYYPADLYINSGRLGIGIVSPRASLHISGYDNLTHSAKILLEANTSANNFTSRYAGIVFGENEYPSLHTYQYWEMGVDLHNALRKDFSILNNEINETAVHIRSSDNYVGIGTTNPQAKLDIQSAQMNQVRIRNTSNYNNEMRV